MENFVWWGGIWRGGGGGSSPKADPHIDTLMERANLLQTQSLSGFHKWSAGGTFKARTAIFPVFITFTPVFIAWIIFTLPHAVAVLGKFMTYLCVVLMIFSFPVLIKVRHVVCKMKTILQINCQHLREASPSAWRKQKWLVSHQTTLRRTSVRMSNPNIAFF